MARSIFGFGPMGVIPEQPKAPDPAEQRKAIEGQASQFQVPANVLMALRESGIEDTGTAAQKIAADMKAGKTVDQIVGPELMNRAYDIADQLYPKPVAPDRPVEANAFRDVPAAVASSVSGAAGSMLKGIGEFGAGVADTVKSGIVNPVIEGFTGKKDVMPKSPNPVGAIADYTLGDKGLAGYLDSFVSDEVKQDMADLTDPNADLFDPSTWKMGKRPTVRGAIYSAVDVFGSMAPIVAVGALTRSPQAAAAAGGAMSAGDAASNAEQVIDQMAATKLEDGRSQLEAESSTYQRLIAGGMDAQEALRVTKRKAAQQSAVLAAIPGALGGAATQKILHGTNGLISKLPWGGRVAGTAALSGIEEGAQEAAEGIAGRIGINTGAGVDQSITAGSFNDALLGALGGAPMGAGSGALSRRTPQTTGDGSAGGEAPPAGQGNPRPAPDGGADPFMQPPVGPAPAAPRGPIEQIAAAAPDLTPQPEAPAAPSMFPDQKSGSTVRLYDPAADMIHDAVVIGENENGIDVRIEGGIITLPPEEFDQSRVDAIRMDEEAKAAVKGGKKPKASKPAPAPQAPAQGPDAYVDMLFNQFSGGQTVDASGADAPVLKVAKHIKEKGGQLTRDTMRDLAEEVDNVLTLPPEDRQAAMKKVVSGFLAQPPQIADDGQANGGAQNEILDERNGRGASAGGLADPNAGGIGLNPAQAEMGGDGLPQRPTIQPVPKGASDAAGTGEYAPALNGEGAPAAPMLDDGLPADIGSKADSDAETAAVEDAIQAKIAQREKDMADVVQPNVKPMEPDPQKRVQDDMFGGQPVTETDMARKERDRREWGKLLSIAEDGTTGADMDFQGRKAFLRKNKVILLAGETRGDLDRIVDTDGMTRDDIAAAVRGALQELDRVAPLPKPAAAPAPQAAPAPIKQATPPQPAPAPQSAPAPAPQAAAPAQPAPAPVTMAQSKLSVENIREKAAVLRGLPKDAPRPDVGNLAFKWDEKEGGYIFARSKTDKILAAAKAVEAEMAKTPQWRKDLAEINPFPDLNKEGDAVAPSKDKAPAAKKPTKAETAALDDAPMKDLSKLDFDAEDNQTREDGQFSPAKREGRAETARWAKAIAKILMDEGFEQMTNAKGKALPLVNFHYGMRHELDETSMKLQTPQGNTLHVWMKNSMSKGHTHTILVQFQSNESTRSNWPNQYLNPTSTPSQSAEILKTWAERFDNSVAEKAEPKAPTAAEVAAEAAKADTSPTDKQKEAGNYQKGHIAWNGLDLSIETAKGESRTGTDSDGETWSVKMPAHYGDIKGTTGADGDPIDFYMGDTPESDTVVVVDQINAETGAFDEHKAMLGFTNRKTALDFYVQGFSDGKGADRLGAHKVMTVAEFKAWVKDGDHKKPVRLGEKEAAAKDPDFEEVSRHLTGQIERAKSQKNAVGDATVRRLRMNIWKAEEAIAKALESGQFKPFEEVQADFPIAATALKSVLGKRAPNIDNADLLKAAQDSGKLEIVHVTAKKSAPAPAKAEPAPAKPSGLKGLTEAENAELAALQARFKSMMNNQINSGLDPAMVAIAVKMGALYVKAGIRRFRALVDSMMNDMGLTLEQAQPYARNAYNQIRGDMDLNGEDVSDMDSDSDVIAEVRKMRAEAEAAKVASPSQEAAKDGNVESTDNQGDSENDAGPAIYEGGSSELEGTPSEPLQDLQAGKPAGTRSAEGEQERGGSGGEADGAGDAAPRSGRAGSARNGKSATKRPVKSKQENQAEVDPDKSGNPTADSAKVKDAKVNVPAANFTITDDVRLGQGGIAEKFADNIAAIRLLKQIQRENRRASPQEQAVLARYVGWGGMKNAFRVAGSKGTEGIAKGWEKRAAEVEELLEPAEYVAARNSTKAAHYTSQSVVKAIWEGARRLGFRGGAVLEPSVGSGNFLGLMPSDMRGTSRVTAVEYDAITAGIAKLLYPASNVLHSGFEKLPIPMGSQSLAIGNPPFGRDTLYFRHNPEINRKTIHNQFFLASMDSLAPNGVLAMVVSHYLLDALDNSNRVQMAGKAELMHAIRLPSNAFEENANTEVVTDILFFRKYDEKDASAAKLAASLHGLDSHSAGVALDKVKDMTKELKGRVLQIMAANSRWVDAEKVNDPAGSDETINVSTYFLRNKKNIIGKLDASGTMNGRGGGLNVTLEDPKQFEEKLTAAIEAIAEEDPVDGIAERTMAGYEAMSESLKLAARNAQQGEVRVDENGALQMVIDAETLGDSKTMQLELELTEETPWHPDYSYRADRKWQITEDVLGEDGKPEKQLKADGTKSTRNKKTIKVIESLADIPARRKWGAKRIELLKDILPIKQLMKRQFVLESQDGTDQQIEDNRAKLNTAYDAFVKKHGKLNAKATAEIAFQMPDGALALGAEVVAKDGSISKSAIMSKRISRPFVMAETADSPSDALAISLSERGAIDIERVAALLGVDVEKAGEMLSDGDKPLAFYDPELERWDTADSYLSGLVKRKLYAAQQAGLQKNISALEAVQPEQWNSTQISPNIGSTWIPTSVYQDFMKHLGYSYAKITFMSVTNTFSSSINGDPKPVWATTGRAFSPSEIVMRMLNSLPMKVTYTDNEGRTHVDEQASVESQQKATEIASEFLDWAYQDSGRRNILVETFNERYNTRVIRQRDGSHLKMPTKGPAITLRRHQVNAIWRGITDKAVLYDHAVGAGKTFTAIARVMERRRMGLSRKPMVIVPNHLIEQWAADFKILYPSANILAAGGKDFETNNRRRLFSKIASGDYDAVIIGHSSFDMIDIDPSTEARFLEDELRAATDAIAEAEEAAREEGYDGGWRKPMGVAEAERLVTKIQTRLDKLRDRNRDRLITFEEMGIDDLTVDESHEFKNLAYSSRLQNVSGMGNKNGSGKATNLNLKARSLHEREGTSIALLSGTPISNSVSEMYLILRNLVPNELREMGLENFDAWRSAFVSVSTQWEPTESGSLKEVARLGREWTNMRALMDLYYSVADAVPIEDVKKNYPLDNNGKRFPIPPVKSQVEGKGDREMVAVKPDEAQRQELRQIVSGFEGLKGLDVKERNAERLRLMDRARKVSLDARAVNPRAKVADGTGKIGATVENVMRLYEKWNDDKGTQVIFLDRSVPKAQGAEKFIAEYDDLVDKLRVAEAQGDDKAVEKLNDKLEKYDRNEVEAQREAVAGGWNAYSDIKRQLIAKGIPAEEIAFVQDAKNDAEKKELFERVNSGEVRVILGSTPRMGAGTNIQKRLVGLHHVDVTWKPSDIEQREGRIVRFGNDLLDKYGFDLFNVEVLAYATEMTVDAKMWSLNATKLKAINGIRKYDGSFNMEFEDEESAGMAEMAALATGNPLMVERVTLDGDLQKMDMSRRTFNNRINGMRAELEQANKTIETADGRADLAMAFAETIRKARADTIERSALRQVNVDGKIFKNEADARAAIQAEITKQRAGDENARWSIQLNGNKVTAADTANSELTRIFGTDGFEASVNGQVEASFARASAAIADQINKTVAAARSDDSVAIDGITILGLPVEIDSYKGKYYRDETTRDVSFTFLQGKKEAWSIEQTAAKGIITQQAVRAALEKIFDYMTVSGRESDARYYLSEKEKAIQKKPELEVELGKAWPMAEEYETKKARLSEVVGLLEKASINDQLGQDDGESDGEDDNESRIASVPSTALRDVAASLEAEVKGAGLQGKVSAALVRGLLGSAGVPIQGRQRGASIAVSESAADPVGVMRHEIVHALRDAALWGQAYGLFTGAEWKSLVAAARADKELMARVAQAYPDLSTAGQFEEAVAEMYREWAGARADASTSARIFNKVASFLRALASALRGNGFNDAARVMERIASGTVGGRGPNGGGDKKGSSPKTSGSKEMRAPLTNARDKFKGMIGSTHWKDPVGFLKNLVTDAMAGKGDFSALALVPARPLFTELGKHLHAAKSYLRTKEDMDSLRNDWHHRADEIAQKWLKLRADSPRENDVFMDLMHRSTLSGIDPSQKYDGERADEARAAAYYSLKGEFDRLPSGFQALFGEVLAAYDKMGDDFEKAVLNNIANATKIGLKRAERAYEKELQRIQDEGLEGNDRDEAIASADAVLKKVKRRGGFSAKARISTLRKTFESNRLTGPYFPLARFGEYFATVRDENGKVVSFSRFEKEAQQQAFVREQKAAGAQRIEVGVMTNKDQLKGMVDPTFVADIENMLAESGATDDVMDAVWQRWLETLPDQSIRTTSIHRKGRAGYNRDAFRAFGKHMFHGAHQLARLEYGLLLEEHINDADDEARKSANPNRSGLLVNEMRKRHAFTMNPTGNSAVASMSSAAFVWYLGASPAAALANISQTTVVGIPLMAARFSKAGVTGSTKALGRASKDFFSGKGAVTKKVGGMPVWTEQWTAENSPNLSADEIMAMKEAVRRGTIDKTQAHDLASVAETGIEYNPAREKWMKRIGWFFHQAERFNREVTFLANYRLARDEGLAHSDAIDAAADLTWKIHFDYQNTSRPRFMQNDIGKVLTTFRQFTVNLLWRMFRDTHQALNGATKEDRAEARAQLIGVTLSMMAHAGIKGTWGYGLLMMLLGMLAPSADDDDLEEWLQDALLLEGDSMGVAAWNYAMGAALNGAAGQVLGVDLSERIGSPNLWFRDAQNNLEGSDLASHYATEILGPVYGIADGFFRGASLAADGNWWRGVEAASPKVIRDGMKAARYMDEGVLTLKGDVLADGIGVLDALKQVNGFTPAKIAERHDINSRLRDRQDQIVDERSSIQREAGDAALAGEPISDATRKKILDFNSRYPEYPITGDTIRKSAQGRKRATQRNEFGLVLNTRLNDRLRSERAPSVYN